MPSEREQRGELIEKLIRLRDRMEHGWHRADRDALAEAINALSLPESTQEEEEGLRPEDLAERLMVPLYRATRDHPAHIVGSLTQEGKELRLEVARAALSTPSEATDQRCPECKGSGQLVREEWLTADCPTCHGSGLVGEAGTGPSGGGRGLDSCPNCGSDDPEQRPIVSATNGTTRCTHPWHTPPERCPTCGSDDRAWCGNPHRGFWANESSCPDPFHTPPEPEETQ